MNFLFHLWNHTPAGIRSLEDVVGIMGRQLRALGHGAIWDKDNGMRPGVKPGTMTYNIKFLTDPDSYNIIVEGFTPRMVEILADIRQQNGKIICLATEEPTATGFNHGLTREFAIRQDWFELAGPYLNGILHLVPGQAVNEWYSKFAPTAQAELGYAPTLVRAETVYEPPHDFIFFGTLSRRRMVMINRLIKRLGGDRSKVLIVKTLPPQAQRDALTQKAKVVIQLRKANEMGLVSSSRCNTALNCGRPVIAEPHDLALSKPWDQIVTFAPTEDEFFELALEARAVWRKLHAWQFANFKRLLTPEYCVGEPLRRIGVVERQRVAA
jgi:hypothetical protein